MKGIDRRYPGKRMPECQETTRGTRWGSIPVLLQKVSLHVASAVAQRKKRRLALLHLALLLVLIGLCSLFLGEPHIASAAQAHLAHPSSSTLGHSVSTSWVTRISLLAPANAGSAPPVNAGSSPDPTIINDQFYCPQPFIPHARIITFPPELLPFIPSPAHYEETCVQGPILGFPCSDILNLQNGSRQPSEEFVRNDWLSGDPPIAMSLNTRGVSPAGHLMYTFRDETYGSAEIMTLFGYMQALGFVLIVPSILLLGYQIMWGASTFESVGFLEGFSRVLLGGLAVAASYAIVQMLISFETLVTAGILVLHREHPFPPLTVNGVPVPYRLFNATKPGEPITSYRGIVVPMSRWGCAINDFMGIFSVPFVANTLPSLIPVLGDYVPLAQTVTSLADLIHRIGDMILMVLSAVLWIQVFVRIFLLNYYIVTGPLAFGCWALPGGVGQRVVRLWCKGFFCVLFVQVLQMFLLTTIPLLLPTLPEISADSVGLVQGILLEFPPILTLWVALMAPRLLGTSAAKAFGTAGSMAEGVIVAVGSATSNML